MSAWNASTAPFALRGRPAAFDLPGRDDGVERGRIGWLGWGIVAVRHDGELGKRPAPRGAQRWETVGEQLYRVTGIEQYLAGHGVQRADLDRLGAGHVGCELAGDTDR